MILWESPRLINKELSDQWKVSTPEGNSIYGFFMPVELAAALKHLDPGKSPSFGTIFTEFIFHAGSALKSWLCDILTSCMRQLKLPRICRRALIVAIPKPEKPVEDPESYRPISLLYVHFKILERLIYTCVEPITDPLVRRNKRAFDTGGRP